MKKKAKKTKSRIFIECTHTFFYGGNTGIQRVVRNLANHSTNLNIKEVEVNPIVWTGFCFCQPKSKLHIKPYILIRIKNWIKFHLYNKHKEKPGWFKSSIILFSRLIFQKNIRKPIFKFLCGFSYLIMSFRLIQNFLLLRFVSFRHGDIVVLVDSTWRSNAMLNSLFKAQIKTEIKVGAMLHDLFPLLLPDTCDEITALSYTHWFKRIVPRADFFVTNSEATRTSLQQYLNKKPKLRPHSYASGSFRLGAELDLANKKEKKSRYIQPLWNTHGKVILCIGTIEPRKNHSYLLDVFDIMRQRGANISLIIIGHSGWKSIEVLERIRSHSDFGKRLLHFDKASDRELAEALKRADCLVCPSIAEGFGLPVVEGLMHGLEVFASAIPPFFETGSNYCHFFDLNSPKSLVDQLEIFFSKIKTSKSTENKYSWPNWEESTCEFIELVLNLSASG